MENEIIKLLYEGVHLKRFEKVFGKMSLGTHNQQMAYFPFFLKCSISLLFLVHCQVTNFESLFFQSNLMVIILVHRNWVF